MTGLLTRRTLLKATALLPVLLRKPTRRKPLYPSPRLYPSPTLYPRGD